MNAHSMKEAGRKHGQRILSLWLPYLAAERILRQRLGRSWRLHPLRHRPLVISHREKNTQRVAALDTQAEALGLKRGMGIADARAMHPSIDVVEADPEATSGLLDGLADWCSRYTPLVARDGHDGLFLDITGCAHLFDGERPLLDDLRLRFSRQGFDVRAGIASTAGTAWAAARFQGDRIIAGGGEATFLAPLPLSALRIGEALCAKLESLGLRTAGAVMTMPRAPLARRFGTVLPLRLDQALGRLDEAISPRMPVAPLSAERHLAEPVMASEDVEFLIEALATTLKADLERRGEGARAFSLSLFRVDGVVSRLDVGTSRPLRDPLLVRRLFHERLAGLERQLDAGYGFDLVRLCVPSMDAFDGEQIDLSGQARHAADEGEAGIALLADRIRARLGGHAILIPVAVASHWPERAVAYLPFTQEPQRITPPQKKPGRIRKTPWAPPFLQERPIRLFRAPEPVEVPMTEMPEGPPLRFRWRRALHRVAHAEGPERIAPEWWHTGSGVAEASTRDYFRVEDTEGRRYWLYRQGLYDGTRPSPRWFMHGIFA